MKKIGLTITCALFLAGGLEAAPDTAPATNAVVQAPALTPAERGQGEFDLGLGLMRDRKYSGAAEAFERATADKPDFAEAYNDWGICLVQLGKQNTDQQQQLQQFQAAAEKFGKAAQFKPGEKITYMLWSETLVLIGDLPVDRRIRLTCYQSAVDKCRKAVELAPEDWEPYNKWAVVLSTKLADFAVDDKARYGLFKEAASLFAKAADRARFSSELGPAYANWGSALVRAARVAPDVEEKKALLREALDQFDRSATAIPKAAGTYAMWGSAYIELSKLSHMRGDLREGIERLNISLSLDQNNPATLYNLACAYALMDNPVLAVQTLKQCFDLDPAKTYRTAAPHDPDLASLHDDPNFQELFGASPSRNLPPYNPPLPDSAQ
jgi:tetratricopeptide (TPR) repeat protein